MSSITGFIVPFINLVTILYGSIVLGVAFLVKSEINMPFEKQITIEDTNYTLEKIKIYDEGLLKIKVFAVASYRPSDNSSEEYQAIDFIQEHFSLLALRDIRNKDSLRSDLKICKAKLT